MKYKKRADGRYHAKVSVGTDASGKLIRKDIYATSIKELEDKKSALKYQYANNLIVKTPEMRMRDYCQSLLSTYAKSRSKNTQAMYRNIIEKHIIPSIGHIPVCKVRYTDIQQMIDERMEKPRPCQQILMVMRQISKSAIHDNLCTKDMCYLVKAPAYSAGKKRALTELEKEAIKKADFTSREKCFVYLLFYLGLRREEAIALSKFDIDFAKNTVSINKAIIFDGNNPEYKDPKSFSGIRINPLPAELIPFLKEYLSTLPGTLLVPKSDGVSVLTKSAYDKMWANIVKKMNNAVTSENEKRLGYKPIDGLTAHIFRHNYATMLYYSGISMKKAAALMGHSDVNLIMNIYAHLDEEKENARAKLDSVICL